MSETHQHQFGRADDEGNVYLTTADGERWVGQYPGTPEEALGFYERKYQDLAGQVNLAEQRARGGAKAKDMRKSVQTLREALTEPAVVGDVAALTARVDALAAKVDDLDAAQRQQSAEAVIRAGEEREAIVAEIERLAATPAEQIRWKDVHAKVEEIFGRWKEHQRTTARLPKTQADALWNRFKHARRTLEDGRRAFFAQLDEHHKEAKRIKQELIAEAQRLAEQAEPRVNDYRALLDRWKAAGRAGAKIDDRLWEQFKAAGDAVFAKKHEQDALTDAEYRENLTQKEALLVKAEALLPVTDWRSARASLRHIQDEWDAIGRVPRESVRTVEGRLRAVEDAVREAEERSWKRSDTSRTERATGLAQQLQESIADLQRQLDEAKASGDDRKAADLQGKIDTQRGWLRATGVEG